MSWKGDIYNRKRKKYALMSKCFLNFSQSLYQNESNHRHQYKVLTLLKNDPSEDKLVLHIDFSEKYVCKLHTETQFFHFRGSRRQVILYTEIIYYNRKPDEIKQGFCTISSSVRHDPCATWPHLKPIFNLIVMLNSSVKQIYIISDSPTSQYRNKLQFTFPSEKL
jgi:hypothetical protein